MRNRILLGVFVLVPLLAGAGDDPPCVRLRKRVDAFTWQNNPFKNPGDLRTVQQAFEQWPRAIDDGRMVILDDGCYVDLQVTAAGQVAGATYRGGSPFSEGASPDARPEMRRALERLKQSVARLQDEIAWLESQLAGEPLRK
jgi:hypothetical protein